MTFITCISSARIAEKRHNGSGWRSWLSKQMNLQPPLKRVQWQAAVGACPSINSRQCPDTSANTRDLNPSGTADNRSGTNDNTGFSENLTCASCVMVQQYNCRVIDRPSPKVARGSFSVPFVYYNFGLFPDIRGYLGRPTSYVRRP